MKLMMHTPSARFRCFGCVRNESMVKRMARKVVVVVVVVMLMVMMMMIMMKKL